MRAILTKDAQIEKLENQSVPTVRGHMLCRTKGVLNTKSRHLGDMWLTNKNHMPQPSLTTSYRPISLISSIMKLFEKVTEQRLRSHLEKIGFLNKHRLVRFQRSTNDHLFRLSQSIMESFKRGEHVVAAFLDVKKAFDNVRDNGLRNKIFS